MTDLKGYLAVPGFEAELVTELTLADRPVEERHQGLLLAPPPEQHPAWAANVWFDPVRLTFSSISEAAGQLRAIQRNWALHHGACFRRSQLIAARLPHVSARPVEFNTPLPTNPMGSWTMLDENTLLASAHCSSPFPHGEYRFVEDRKGPPSRAYLKLWEALTRLGTTPGPGDICLDLGASPGGWTWVLAGLGAHVISIDKAPLDPCIERLKNVEVRRESAFALLPAAHLDATWIVCDVICYPERLLRLIHRWLDAGTRANFVCTLKFQGETDFNTISAFKAIPGSALVHLHHNKHELTWLRPWTAGPEACSGISCTTG